MLHLSSLLLFLSNLFLSFVLIVKVINVLIRFIIWTTWWSYFCKSKNNLSSSSNRRKKHNKHLESAKLQKNRIGQKKKFPPKAFPNKFGSRTTVIRTNPNLLRSFNRATAGTRSWPGWARAWSSWSSVRSSTSSQPFAKLTFRPASALTSFASSSSSWLTSSRPFCLTSEFICRSGICIFILFFLSSLCLHIGCLFCVEQVFTVNVQKLEKKKKENFLFRLYVKTLLSVKDALPLVVLIINYITFIIRNQKLSNVHFYKFFHSFYILNL